LKRLDGYWSDPLYRYVCEGDRIVAQPPSKFIFILVKISLRRDFDQGVAFFSVLENTKVNQVDFSLYYHSATHTQQT
jgi:hypothetical protein